MKLSHLTAITITLACNALNVQAVADFSFKRYEDGQKKNLRTWWNTIEDACYSYDGRGGNPDLLVYASMPKKENFFTIVHVYPEKDCPTSKEISYIVTDATGSLNGEFYSVKWEVASKPDDVMEL